MSRPSPFTPTYAALADVLAPDDSDDPTHDIAFADTVVADDMDPPPSSRRVAPFAPPAVTIVFDAAAVRDDARSLTPLAFPLAPHGIHSAVDEMRELWEQTLAIVSEQRAERGMLVPPSPPLLFMSRLLALWSCFQWSRGDLTRAAAITAFVLVAAGVTFATTAHASDAADVASAGEAAQVRAARTLEQHTGHAVVLRRHR
ncbi:MAG: hypothetical protein JWP97_6767 [Labilithrix sp.]|nr:hypothetical protein [Labilithrix sp.]